MSCGARVRSDVGARMRIAILLLNSGRGSGEVARAHGRYLVEAGHRVIFMHPKVGAGAPGSSNLDNHTDVVVTPDN